MKRTKNLRNDGSSLSVQVLGRDPIYSSSRKPTTSFLRCVEIPPLFQLYASPWLCFSRPIQSPIGLSLPLFLSLFFTRHRCRCVFLPSCGSMHRMTTRCFASKQILISRLHSVHTVCVLCLYARWQQNAEERREWPNQPHRMSCTEIAAVNEQQQQAHRRNWWRYTLFRTHCWLFIMLLWTTTGDDRSPYFVVFFLWLTIHMFFFSYFFKFSFLYAVSLCWLHFNPLCTVRTNYGIVRFDALRLSVGANAHLQPQPYHRTPQPKRRRLS